MIIKGLVSRPELTGVHGIVERKAAKAGRWNVKLKGLSNIHKFGASISLKTANIEVVPTMPFFTPISGMGSAHPEPANTVIDRSVVRVMRGLKAIKPSLFTPFIMQQADLDQALANSPFNTLSEDLILSILIRASRATHRALSSTCKRFHFLVRGKKFIEARRHCPTTGFSCLEQLLVLVGGGGGSVAHSDIMGNGISVFSPGGPWCQGTFHNAAIKSILLFILNCIMLHLLTVSLYSYIINISYALLCCLGVLFWCACHVILQYERARADV